MLHITEVKTVGDYLHNAAEIARDTENHKNIIGAILLDCLTHVGYQFGSGMLPNHFDHTLYPDHLRVRAMDVEAQVWIKGDGGGCGMATTEDGCPNLFAVRTRQGAAEVLDKAAARWDAAHA